LDSKRGKADGDGLLPQINETGAGQEEDMRTYWRSNSMKSPDQAAFKVILIVTMIFALVMLPFVAKAGSEPHSGPPSFTDVDKDGDGFISEEELAAFRAARMAAMVEEGRKMKGAAFAPPFADMDSNGDGLLDEAEFTAGRDAHMKKMREMHQAQGDGMHQGKGMQHGKGMKMPTFGDLDLDSDGCINADEFAKHQAERHGKSE
jgi:hypothetical protein